MTEFEYPALPNGLTVENLIYVVRASGGRWKTRHGAEAALVKYGLADTYVVDGIEVGDKQHHSYFLKRRALVSGEFVFYDADHGDRSLPRAPSPLVVVPAERDPASPVQLRICGSDIRDAAGDWGATVRVRKDVILLAFRDRTTQDAFLAAHPSWRSVNRSELPTAEREAVTKARFNPPCTGVESPHQTTLF